MEHERIPFGSMEAIVGETKSALRQIIEEEARCREVGRRIRATPARSVSIEWSAATTSLRVPRGKRSGMAVSVYVKKSVTTMVIMLN